MAVRIHPRIDLASKHPPGGPSCDGRRRAIPETRPSQPIGICRRWPWASNGGIRIRRSHVPHHDCAGDCQKPHRTQRYCQLLVPILAMFIFNLRRSPEALRTLGRMPWVITNGDSLASGARTVEAIRQKLNLETVIVANAQTLDASLRGQATDDAAGQALLALTRTRTLVTRPFSTVRDEIDFSRSRERANDLKKFDAHRRGGWTLVTDIRARPAVLRRMPSPCLRQGHKRGPSGRSRQSRCAVAVKALRRRAERRFF